MDFTFPASATIDANTITRNSSGVAQAIHVAIDADVNITNNVIQGNGLRPTGGTGTIGAILYNGDGSINNNLITGNVGGGGSVYFQPSAGSIGDPVEFHHNTVSGNWGEATGGLEIEGDPGPVTPFVEVINSIITMNAKSATTFLDKSPDMHFLETGGAAPTTVTFAFSHLGLASGTGGSWTPEQLLGGTPPFNTNTSHFPSPGVVVPIEFVAPLLASGSVGPVVLSPTIGGDWHLMASSAAFGAGDFLAALSVDLLGVTRSPGETDIGALQVPEPATLVVFLCGGIWVLTGRRKK